MRRAAIALNVLAAVLGLGSGIAHAQARGPSLKQNRKEGQHVIGDRELWESVRYRASEEAEQDRIALLDPVERARRFAELETLLRRLPGRFQIEGRIEWQFLDQPRREGDITGIADCSAVGVSIGLNCIINASWPIIEPPLNVPITARLRPPPSEQLNTMRPAVLVVGLNIDPPGLRAMMVTADTLAFNWVGTLQGGVVSLERPSRCWNEVRCFQAFEIIVQPDSPIVSFALKAGAYTLKLTMHPDPDAMPGKPLKPLKAR